jgi:hypothetical protein
MFGLFKKGNNKGKGSLKPISPEGEQISKPIAGNVQGKLRHALELMAYVLENDLNKNQHIITFVATVDPANEKEGEHGIESMDCAFVRASDESIGEILMQVGMRDDTFAKSMIAVAQAIQFHKPHLKDYADNLMKKVEEGQRNGEIPKTSNYTGSSTKGKRRGLNIEDFGKNMKGISIDDLSKASDKEIDDLIDGLINKARDEEDED